jgi:sugar lactone lactonase YvrE
LPITAPGYDVDCLVPGSPFNGVHGLRFGPDGAIYVGSLAKQSIYRVDPATGDIGLAVGPPYGDADDVAFAPDGTLYWTAPDRGAVFAKAPNGPVRAVATGLPGINGITFRGSRLYASSVFLGDELYEIDPVGRVPPRMILEGIGGLNGNEFGPDDKLYGPLWFKGQVAQIDVDRPELTVLADGFMRPSAVKVAPDGNLWLVDAGLGRLFNLDRETGKTIRSVALSPSIDNLALDGKGHVYVTNMADNSIQRIDPIDGSVRDIVRGTLSMPGGIVLEIRDGREVLHIADQYAYRIADTAGGELREIARRGGGDNNIPSAVSVGDRFILLSSLRTRSVELRDRRTLERVETVDGFEFPYQALEVPGGILVADYGAGLVLVTGEPGAWRRETVLAVEGVTAMLPAPDGCIYLAQADAGRILRVDAPPPLRGRSAQSDGWGVMPSPGRSLKSSEGGGSTPHPSTLRVADLPLKGGGAQIVAEGLHNPEGLAFLDNKTLLVAEVGNQRLTAIDLETGVRRTVSENLPIGQGGPPGWPSAFVPTGLAVGEGSVIYVASDLDCAIYRLTPR